MDNSPTAFQMFRLCMYEIELGGGGRCGPFTTDHLRGMIAHTSFLTPPRHQPLIDLIAPATPNLTRQITRYFAVSSYIYVASVSVHRREVYTAVQQQRSRIICTSWRTN